MTDKSSQQYDKMTPAAYLAGAVILIIGFVGVYLMVVKPENYPFLTIFLYSIPSNCAIVIFPHEPVLIWYGKTVNIWYLSLVATLGTLMAAWLDYKFFAPLLNLSYSKKYKDSKTYEKAHYWFYKIPFISLVIAGASPIPFFPFKFMVYASKYPIWRYLAAVAVGRLPRYVVLASAGLYFQIPNWIIFGGFGFLLLIIYSKQIIRGIKGASIGISNMLIGRKPVPDEISKEV